MVSDVPVTGVRPDYDNGIVNLMASLRAGLGAPATAYQPLEQLSPATVAAARCVVLVVLDGLGLHYLQHHGQQLGRYLRGSLSSVFPSSTAPAVTSLMTATGPQQHAITGWFMYLRELGAVTTILPYQIRPGGLAVERTGLSAARCIGAPGLCAQLPQASHYVIGHDLADSAYSRALAGPAQRHGYRSLADCCQLIQHLARAGGERRYIYAYWPRFDGLAHRHGVASAEVRRHFAELEHALIELIGTLRGSDTLLLATADHGFIDTEPAQVLNLARHPTLAATLALPLCGEPRAAFCYLRDGCRAAFEHYAGTVLGRYCDCLPCVDLLAQGWFGRGAVHPRLLERLGDYVLLMRERYILVEQLPGEPPWSLIGVHGGTSSDEMRVPLLVAEC